jgi:hypothetical protein
MKYFLHDSNARNDEKITLLFIKYGYEGVGLFFTILEILSQQEKPINKIVLEAQLKIRKRHQNFINYMIEIGLISLQNDEVFNENLLKYSENYQIRKEKNSEKIKKWRENQQDKKSVTSYEPDCNRTKVKESKLKESKVNESIVLPFDSKSFIDKWDIWKKFRSEMKKPYKGIIAEQSALKGLCELANGDETTAIEIINQSLRNGWQGFFELKNKQNGLSKSEQYIRSMY